MKDFEIHPIGTSTEIKYSRELIDAIEELDDVQNVFSDFDVSDEVMSSVT